LSSFHKKKNLNFLVHSWFKDTSLLSNLVKISLNIPPTSVIRRPNCYWSNFYPKKNPIFLYKNISLCVGWWPGNLYTTNFFNLEINVNLVSYQNLWTFLLYLSISMHFDSDPNLLFVQILCIYAVFTSTYGTSIFGIWKFLCKNSSTSRLLWCTWVNFCVFFYKKVGCQTIKFFWKMDVNHAGCVNQRIGVKPYLLVKSATSCDLSACFGLEFLCPYPIYHANHQLPCALEP